MMVQEEMVRRAHLETGTGKKRVYSGKYALSSIMYCGECGDMYQRAHWNIHGRKKIVWRCVSRLHKKRAEVECSSRTVSEADIHEAVVQAVNEICAGKETVLPKLKENIIAVVADNNNERVKELDRQIAGVEEEILERTKARKSCDDLGEEILRLREERYRLQLEDATKEGMRQKIDEMEAVLEEMGWKVTEYKEELVRKLIERITVFDDYILVEFKSGVETEIKI